MLVFDKFQKRDDAPPDIGRFEGWFVGSLAAGVLVAITQYDVAVEAWGGYFQAALVSIALFGGYWLLMICASRRRSNWARWLLVVISIVALVPYLIYVSVLLETMPLFYLSFAQGLMQVVALCYLFTPPSRAWFAGRALPLEGEIAN